MYNVPSADEGQLSQGVCIRLSQIKG